MKSQLPQIDSWVNIITIGENNCRTLGEVCLERFVIVNDDQTTSPLKVEVFEIIDRNVKEFFPAKVFKIDDHVMFQYYTGENVQPKPFNIDELVVWFSVAVTSQYRYDGRANIYMQQVISNNYGEHIIVVAGDDYQFLKGAI